MPIVLAVLQQWAPPAHYVFFRPLPAQALLQESGSEQVQVHQCAPSGRLFARAEDAHASPPAIVKRNYHAFLLSPALEPAVYFEKNTRNNEEDATTDDGTLLAFRDVEQNGATNHENHECSD